MKSENLQVFLFILGLILILYVLKLFKTIKKERRLDNFSLDNTEYKKSILTNINLTWWRIINKLSYGLEKNKLILKLSKKYDKYILNIETKYKKNTDYFTIKLLIVIITIAMYIIGMVFFYITPRLETFILCLVLSYIIPDLLWQYQYQKKVNKVNKELYIFIKYLYNMIKQGNNLNESLRFSIKSLENPIKDEAEKILSDLEYGLSLTQSFKRFFERSKLKKVESIYKTLVLGDKLNLSLKESLSNIYNSMTIQNRKEEEFNTITSLYHYIFLVAIITPAIVYFFGITIKLEYFTKLFNSIYGYLVLFLIIIIYTIYIYIMNNLLEGYHE